VCTLISFHMTPKTSHSAPRGYPAMKSSRKILEGDLYTDTVVLQIELGTACGKLFRCSTMSILDAGDSDILSSTVA